MSKGKKETTSGGTDWFFSESHKLESILYKCWYCAGYDREFETLMDDLMKRVMEFADRHKIDTKESEYCDDIL